MLKWKTYKFGAITNGVESLNDMLAGASGKNRVITHVTADIDSDIYIRIYRNADQMVNFECDLITTAAPILPVNIPLKDGDIAKIGFYNLSAGSVTPSIAIGYEEAE